MSILPRAVLLATTVLAFGAAAPPCRRAAAGLGRRREPDLGLGHLLRRLHGRPVPPRLLDHRGRCRRGGGRAVGLRLQRQRRLAAARRLRQRHPRARRLHAGDRRRAGWRASWPRRPRRSPIRHRIDPLAGLAGDRVYLFHGESDSVVAAPVATAAEAFYRTAGIDADGHAHGLPAAGRQGRPRAGRRPGRQRLRCQCEPVHRRLRLRPGRRDPALDLPRPGRPAGAGHGPQDRVRPDRVPGGCRGLGPRARGRGLYPRRLRGRRRAAGCTSCSTAACRAAPPTASATCSSSAPATCATPTPTGSCCSTRRPTPTRRRTRAGTGGAMRRRTTSRRRAPQLAAVRAMLDRLAEPKALAALGPTP